MRILLVMCAHHVTSESYDIRIHARVVLSTLPTPVNGHYDNSNQQLNTSHYDKDVQRDKDMQQGVGLGWVRCQRFWLAFGAALLAEVGQHL